MAGYSISTITTSAVCPPSINHTLRGSHPNGILIEPPQCSRLNRTRKTEINDLLTDESYSAARCVAVSQSCTGIDRYRLVLILKRSCKVNPVIPMNDLRCTDQFPQRPILRLLDRFVKPPSPFLNWQCFSSFPSRKAFRGYEHG